MIYWITNSITSSFRIYRDTAFETFDWINSFEVNVPTGYALSRVELINGVSKSLSSYYYTNITLWTVVPKGGHFFAMEEPEFLNNEIRKFYHTLHGKSLVKEEL